MKYNLKSYETWKRRNNPKISCQTDGMFPCLLSKQPTLVKNGFVFIGDQDGTEIEKDKKGVAKKIIDDYFSMPGKKYDEKMEFVYWEHRGSCINSMPNIVYVYGRLETVANCHGLNGGGK